MRQATEKTPPPTVAPTRGFLAEALADYPGLGPEDYAFMTAATMIAGLGSTQVLRAPVDAHALDRRLAMLAELLDELTAVLEPRQMQVLRAEAAWFAASLFSKLAPEGFDRARSLVDAIRGIDKGLRQAS